MAEIVHDAPIPLFYVLFLVLLAAFVVFSLAVVAACPHCAARTK